MTTQRKDPASPLAEYTKTIVAFLKPFLQKLSKSELAVVNAACATTFTRSSEQRTRINWVLRDTIGAHRNARPVQTSLRVLNPSWAVVSLVDRDLAACTLCITPKRRDVERYSEEGVKYLRFRCSACQCVEDQQEDLIPPIALKKCDVQQPCSDLENRYSIKLTSIEAKLHQQQWDFKTCEDIARILREGTGAPLAPPGAPTPEDGIRVLVTESHKGIFRATLMSPYPFLDRRPAHPPWSPMFGPMLAVKPPACTPGQALAELGADWDAALAAEAFRATR